MPAATSPAPAAQPRALLWTLVAASLVILYLAYRVFEPFFLTLAVAASFAMLLAPPYRRLVAKLGGRRGVAAGLVVLLVLVVMVLPFLSYAALLGSQASSFMAFVRPYLQPAALLQLWNDELPARFPWLERFHSRLYVDEARLAEIASPALSHLASFANTLVQGTAAGLATALFDIAVFLMALFFLLRDGGELGALVRRLAPLSVAQEEIVLSSLTGTIRGVLLSIVLVPVAQGLLGMLGFALLGVPNALFWGSMVVLASLVPGIGAALVWGPAAIWLFAVGPTWKGVAMIAWGVLAISMVDNVLKPMLLARTSSIHPVLGFLASLGGILYFGAVGFLLGPMVLSLLLSAVRIYQVDVVGPRPEEAPATAASASPSA